MFRHPRSHRGGLGVVLVLLTAVLVVGDEPQRLDVRYSPVLPGTATCDPADDINGADWTTRPASPLAAMSSVDTPAESGTPDCSRHRPGDSTGNTPAFSAPNGPVEAT